MKCNLISTSKATTNHRSVIFKEQYAKIIEPNGSTFVKAVRRGNLYYIEPFIDKAAVAKVSDFQEWYLKLGHLNEIGLKRLKSDNMVQNLNFKDFESLRD